MKKKKLKIYGLAAIMTAYQIMMGFSSTAFAAETSIISADSIQDKPGGVYQAERQYDQLIQKHAECVQGVKKWKKKNGKYQYPVTPYDEAWGKYTQTSEMLAACQIPEEILDQLPTEELLELILDCPELITIKFYDSIEEGVKLMAERFNGMNALLAREDCLAVVSQYYSEYKIPEKQQLDYDALLPGDNPDYDAIINNDKLMKKADEDTKVMLTLNLCEAIMEIAADENKMTLQEKQTVTKMFLKKNKEKAKSEYAEGYFVEENKEDSLLNECRSVFTASSTSKAVKANTSRKGASNDTTGSFTLPDGGVVPYTKYAESYNITLNELITAQNNYSHIKLSNGDSAVTIVGKGGTTAYNCYNFAWLKKWNINNLWKKCDIKNDYAFTKYSGFKTAKSPSSAGWVGAQSNHAVYVVQKEVTYVVSERSQAQTVPMVKSKWGTTGPLMQHPVTVGAYDYSAYDITYYC